MRSHLGEHCPWVWRGGFGLQVPAKAAQFLEQHTPRALGLGSLAFRMISRIAAPVITSADQKKGVLLKVTSKGDLIMNS